jgi:hypothetical protein
MEDVDPGMKRKLDTPMIVSVSFCRVSAKVMQLETFKLPHSGEQVLSLLVSQQVRVFVFFRSANLINKCKFPTGKHKGRLVCRAVPWDLPLDKKKNSKG